MLEEAIVKPKKKNLKDGAINQNNEYSSKVIINLKNEVDAQ